MKETDVEKHLMHEGEKRGAFVWKFVSPGKRGVPDRILLFPGGLIIFVETKAPGEKLRKQQRHRKAEMEAKGQIVWAASTKEEVDQLMRCIDEGNI